MLQKVFKWFPEAENMQQIKIKIFIHMRKFIMIVTIIIINDYYGNQNHQTYLVVCNVYMKYKLAKAHMCCYFENY